MKVKQGVSGEDVLQSAKHTFFVEGGRDGLDVTVLRALHDAWRVEPLGPSLSVRSAAEALHPHHPYYYFIVDRDEQADHEVERTWDNFPDKNTNNLLIWRRKEIESYFLTPDWATKSKYFLPSGNIDAFRAWLVAQFQERLWVEVANRAVVLIRNQIKSEVKGLTLFKKADLQGCDAQSAPGMILEKLPLEEINATIAGHLSMGRVEALLSEALALFLGGEEALVWGQGRWFELMSAKEIFNHMVNQWFRVMDVRNRRVTGREAAREVARELLKDHREAMPTDFGELVRLFEGVRARG